MSGQSQLTSQFQICIIALVIGSITAISLQDFFHADEFLLYRLSLNVHQGHGIVYNAGNQTLTTLSPLLALPLSLSPNNAHHIAAIIFTISNILSVLVLFDVLQKQLELSRQSAMLILVIVLISWPVWSAFRAPSASAFLLILLAFRLSQNARWGIAGLLAALSILFDLQFVIPAIMLAVCASYHSKSFTFLSAALLPLSGWGLIAILTFDAIVLQTPGVSTVWQDGLWIALFLLAVAYLRLNSVSRTVWIFPLWATLMVFSDIILNNTLSATGNLPLAITIGIATSYIAPRLQQQFIAVGIAVFLIYLGMPSLSDDLRDEIDVAMQVDVPTHATILHPYGDAFPYFVRDFEGISHRTDGGYNSLYRNMVTRNDLASVLVATAPDFILTEGDIDLTEPRLVELDYQLVDADVQFYERQSNILDFGARADQLITINPDMSIVGYAIDRQRPRAGEVIRIRLTWELSQLPNLPVGVNLNLVDLQGMPIASSRNILETPIWQSDQITTYHVMRINESAMPGIARVQIDVEYRAGVIAEKTLTDLIFPFDVALQADIFESQVRNVQLYEQNVDINGNFMTIRTVWSVDDPMVDDYQIFLHLTPTDSPIPVTQADGPPTNGRYPTSYWLPGDAIVDERQVSLENVPSGEYILRIGFYLEDGTRISDENGDSITLTGIRVNDDRSAEILDD